MPNPMTVPVMSTVMPNPMTTTTVVGSMGVQGLPMSSAIPIIVDENTPNLAEIQSFPVVVSSGGIHIHQDPVSGQRYRMSDDFHSRIPEILLQRKTNTTQNIVDDGVTTYLNSLMNYNSKPENLVREISTETKSTNFVNSKDILDSAIGIVNITNDRPTATLNNSGKISISSNVNIPGLMTQQQKTELQQSLQNQLNVRPNLFTPDNTKVDRILYQETRVDLNNNFFSINKSTTQTNLNNLQNSIINQFPVNTFSTSIGLTPNQLPESMNLLPTNSFGTVTNNNRSQSTNSNLKLPTNKFYDK